jgi:hypothetical protein
MPFGSPAALGLNLVRFLNQVHAFRIARGASNGGNLVPGFAG